MRNRLACQSSSEDTFRKKIFLNSFGQRRFWFCPTILQPDRAGRLIRPVSTEFRSSARTLTISGKWRRMKAMAIRFYEKGDAADLAEQFIVILQSPELQRQMAEHNFAAGVEMTMTSVVRNYLRWFELQQMQTGDEQARRSVITPPSFGSAGRDLSAGFFRRLQR